MSKYSENKKPETIKKALIVRSLIFLVILITCAYCTYILKDSFFYFLKVSEEPVDLGDLRKKRIDGINDLNLEDNSYVRFKNSMITRRSSTKNYFYFYCPLYHFIIQTKQPMPDVARRHDITVPEGLLYLVKSRQVMPEDFILSFSGEGRLIDLSLNPDKYKHLTDFYSDVLKKLKDEKVYFFIDGEIPASTYIYFIAYIGAGLVIVFAGIMLFITYRKYKKGEGVMVKAEI